MNQSRRRIVAAAMALACILPWPPSAAAEEPVNSITALSIGAASVDLESHIATVVVHFECAADLTARARFTLSQHRLPVVSPAPSLPDHISANSFVTVDVVQCTVSSGADLAIRFGPQRGVFSPGRAEIDGFVSCPFPAGQQSIEPTSITLHPEP